MAFKKCQLAFSQSADYHFDRRILNIVISAWNHHKWYLIIGTMKYDSPLAHALHL